MKITTTMLREDNTVLPLDGPPTVCAYNASKTRVAITDGSRLMVRSTAGDAQAVPSSSPPSDRDVSTSLVDTSAHGAITSMCWIGTGQGHVIVCGTEKGVVMVYSEGKNERVGISNAGYADGRRDEAVFHQRGGFCRAGGYTGWPEQVELGLRPVRRILGAPSSLLRFPPPHWSPWAIETAWFACLNALEWTTAQC